MCECSVSGCFGSSGGEDIAGFAPSDASLLLPFAFVHLPEPSLAPVGTVVAPAIAKLAVALLVADALAAVVQSD